MNFYPMFASTQFCEKMQNCLGFMPFAKYFKDLHLNLHESREEISTLLGLVKIYTLDLLDELTRSITYAINSKAGNKSILKTIFKFYIHAKAFQLKFVLIVSHDTLTLDDIR